LRAHIEFIQRAGFRIIPLRGLVNESPQDGVCLTFDDGYESFFTQTFPVLHELKAPATVFIITDFVGKSNRWDVTFGINRRRHLDWEQILELDRQGIEIGSHGRTHRDLTRLPLTELREELTDSRRLLEDRLGNAVTSLPLSFGASNAQVVMEAKSCGYVEIVGGVAGYYGPYPGILSRMPVYRFDGTGAIRRKLELVFWERLRLGLLQNCSRGTRILNHG